MDDLRERPAILEMTRTMTEDLARAGYLADERTAFMAAMALELRKPLIVEGPAGSGKTYLAEGLARSLGRPLVRLQCYEGMGPESALYDWNYHAQLVALERREAEDPFSERFLLARPLYRALAEPHGAVLLIDEVDRADEAFEALLLEYLGEHAITIPEWRTVRAIVPPVTILTSNRSRVLGDALTRRALFHYLDWPDAAREEAVVSHHVPDLAPERAAELVRAVGLLRQWDLIKPPGLAETIDWARASARLGSPPVDAAFLEATLGVVLKDHLDWDRVRARVGDLSGTDP